MELKLCPNYQKSSCSIETQSSPVCGVTTQHFYNLELDYPPNSPQHKVTNVCRVVCIFSLSHTHAHTSIYQLCGLGKRKQSCHCKMSKNRVKIRNRYRSTTRTYGLTEEPIVTVQLQTMFCTFLLGGGCRRYF